MLTIAGYQTYEKLYESLNSQIYRAHCGQEKVILKLLPEAYPSPERVARFKREYEMTRQFDLAGVISVYGLEQEQHRWLMVVEDFGGESLSRLGVAGQLTIVEFLKLAIKITEILGQIHARQIMHKDINPANLVLNPVSGEIKIIDFGISTALSRENHSFRHPNVLEGTLAYISPEQTGRMNRAMDYRTDFYSLGITFYELLTGRLPFDSEDALELVHSHIAKVPLPPHKRERHIPEALSNVILKLMAKNAEARYQSARGIKADLERCLHSFSQTGQIAPFALGEQDLSDRFQIPDKLYGRQKEIGSLLAGFERVVHDASEMMLVAGYSGIGKSALVQEVHKPITARRGYFISGKFDLLQRDVPYGAFIQAFQSLIRQLLTESEVEVATWKAQLLTALGPNGQVIVDVIPEVELIIGKQPAVPELESHENQNRFNSVFQSFIRVFTQPAHPLTIFLDDLQWSDNATLKLLTLLLTAKDVPSLFLIGAYRDNEVSGVHPLMLTVSELLEAGVSCQTITLSPLALGEVAQLVGDTLHRTPQQVHALARLLQAKTGGNPFFLGEFLKALYADSLLTFDLQEGYWQWDLAQIKRQEITDNVAQLMAAKVKKLPTQTQAVLKLAACIGNQFDLDSLGMVAMMPTRQAAIDIAPALREGLILPLSDAYKFVELDVAGLSEQLTAEYKFVHDGVQQAVYSLIPSADKEATHLSIGRLLLGKGAASGQLFEVVNQLNQGLALITLESEKIQIAELNLKAGQKARKATAYQAAVNYLTNGRGLLPSDSWQTHYQLTLALYLEGAEAASLSGDFEQLERLVKIVEKQATTLLDKVKAVEIQVKTSDILVRSTQTLGFSILRELGIKFPKKPRTWHLYLALAETKYILLGKQPEELISLPKMTDPYKQSVLRIFSSILSYVYLTNPNLFVLLVLKWVNLSVRYGYVADSAYAYALYGGVLSGFLADYDTGYRFGQLALNLCKRLDTRRLNAKIWFTVAIFVSHWKEPLSNTLPALLAAYQSGLESGDLQMAQLAASMYCPHAYFSGQELGTLSEEIASYNNATDQFNRPLRVGYYHQATLNLLGQAEIPYRLNGEAYNEYEAPRETPQQKLYVYMNKMILCIFFQEYKEAYEIGLLAVDYLDRVRGLIFTPFFRFYESLAGLGVVAQVDKSEQKQILKKVASNQKKMKNWAKHAPMNYLHKYYLVEAERAKFLGQDAQAREYYDQAIELAIKHEYVNEEALACELAGRFYLAKGRTKQATIYLRDAHYAYQRWGAIAKVEDLEERYPQLLPAAVPANTLTITSGSTGRQSTAALDFASVLKASQAISGEIRLDKLLAKMMQIACENAGAQLGHLILERSERFGTWVIQATARTEQITVLQSIPLDDKILPLSIVNYVIRTQKVVLLNDAQGEGRFMRDDYIRNELPQSILCAPLLNQGRLIGIFYLENKLTTGAFTPQRLEVLNLLSSQAAISIENATLYNTLEQKVKNRTKELAAATHEAKKANQAKSTFLANMSHELRTPLNAILGFAEVMRHRGDGNKHHLDIIKRSGEHLLNLINSVLDLSKIEAGKMSLNPSNFDLLHLLNELEEMFALPAKDKGLLLSFDISPDLPHYIRTDAVKLRQVLINLLSNAIKYTEQGGVSLHVSHNVGLLHVEVLDTGVGIAAEELETLFEVFTQTEAGKDKQEGTGLGLPISQQFVKLMGGEIMVESQACADPFGGSISHGTRFIFDIQVEEVEAPKEEQNIEHRVIALAPNQPRYRILVVDDKWSNRQLLINLLKPLDFELREASNGEEAIALWQTWQPSLIWMDIRMPVMDGYEATRQIKNTDLRGFGNLGGLASPIIIALTASIYEEEQAAVRQAGCDDFLRKPFRTEQIFDLMSKHLGLRYLYSDNAASLAERESNRNSPADSPLTPATLSTLPSEWRQQLLLATTELNLRRILSLIEEIRPQNEPLADALTELGTRFKFEKLSTLLEAAEEVT